IPGLERCRSVERVPEAVLLLWQPRKRLRQIEFYVVSAQPIRPLVVRRRKSVWHGRNEHERHVAVGWWLGVAVPVQGAGCRYREPVYVATHRSNNAARGTFESCTKRTG